MTETAKEPISNEIIPDYWIISGQVFKNKERFVKQQMEFNPGDIRENWESSFDHFAIPVYRNPIFVSGYENGVKTSFVRKNKILQEQLNTAKKALTEAIGDIEQLNGSDDTIKYYKQIQDFQGIKNIAHYSAYDSERYSKKPTCFYSNLMFNLKTTDEQSKLTFKGLGDKGVSRSYNIRSEIPLQLIKDILDQCFLKIV